MVTPPAPSRLRAVAAVRRRMAELEPPLTGRRLAYVAGLNRETVNDFLAARRWPQDATLRKLEAALGWEGGTLQLIADSAASLGHSGDDVRRSADLAPSTLATVAPDLVTFLRSEIDTLPSEERELVLLELQAFARRRAWEIRRAMIQQE